MAATAAARRVSASPSRRASASRPALKPRPARTTPARRRSQATPVVGFVPIAVGRTAGAVGGMADSGLVVRLTRGRLWIGVLAALLVGIVALNVFSLSLNASSSQVAQQADGLRRANSALQARIAGEVSNDQVLAGAAELGLFYPATDATRYLSLKPNDAALAARRLQAGDFADRRHGGAPGRRRSRRPRCRSRRRPRPSSPALAPETAVAPSPPAAVAPASAAGGVGAP